MTFAANISLRIGAVPRLWLLLAAATFAPFPTFAYDGWYNANLADDGIHGSAIGCDAVHERSTDETRNRSLGNCGFFARFARFLAAKTAVLSGLWRREPPVAVLESMLADAAAYRSWKAHFGEPPAQ